MGVRAAQAAGMQVCRFTGGSHLAGTAMAEAAEAQADRILAELCRLLRAFPALEPWFGDRVTGKPVARAKARSLDDAARAGWLYYVGGMTQDQIATDLGVSRQRAQRLVSRAMAEGLIHVRLEHRLGGCMRLEAELRRRFDLRLARVAPALGPGSDQTRAIAPRRRRVFERFLAYARAADHRDGHRSGAAGDGRGTDQRWTASSTSWFR